jgi:hypothetical protein
MLMHVDVRSQLSFRAPSRRLGEVIGSESVDSSTRYHVALLLALSPPSAVYHPRALRSTPGARGAPARHVLPHHARPSRAWRVTSATRHLITSLRPVGPKDSHDQPSSSSNFEVPALHPPQLRGCGTRELVRHSLSPWLCLSPALSAVRSQLRLFFLLACSTRQPLQARLALGTPEIGEAGPGCLLWQVRFCSTSRALPLTMHQWERRRLLSYASLLLPPKVRERGPELRPLSPAYGALVACP